MRVWRAPIAVPKLQLELDSVNIAGIVYNQLSHNRADAYVKTVVPLVQKQQCFVNAVVKNWNNSQKSEWAMLRLFAEGCCY